MVQIIKEMEVKYKTRSRRQYLTRVTQPENAIKFFKDLLKDECQENFVCLYLDGGNSIIGFQVVTRGLVNKAQVHPREVFKTALLCNAVSIIACHNHPSGEVTPSKADIEITNQIVESGIILGIRVLDHIIITDNDYYSFHENGILRDEYGRM